MRYSTIAGKKTSKIALGTAMFGWTIDEHEASDFLDAYCALGGNFLDTARVYGDIPNGKLGLSEELLGRWMSRRHNRENITISTKGGHPEISSMHVGRLDVENLTGDLSRSLEALQTDSVDVYFLHRDDVMRPVGDILETLNRFVSDQKIRSFGASNWSAERLREANAYAGEHGMLGFSVDQPQFSLAKQMLVEDDTLVQMDSALYRFHVEASMPCMCFSSQAKGFFTKLHALGQEGLSDKARRRFAYPENMAIYERLKKLSHETGHSVNALSLAYLTSQPFDTYPIAGASRIEQVEALGEAADIVLTDEQVQYLRTI